MEVAYPAHDRVVSLEAPEDLYDLAVLLRNPERFAVEAIYSRTSGDQAVAVSTARVHNVASFVTGQDDPVAIVRVQDHFPASGEILAPYAIDAFIPVTGRPLHHPQTRHDLKPIFAGGSRGARPDGRSLHRVKKNNGWSRIECAANAVWKLYLG